MEGTTTTLLDRVRALTRAERGLTRVIENSMTLLPPPSSSSSRSSSSVMSSSYRTSDAPLYPTPRTVEEARIVLALAKSYSLRTSAPPMWNPNLPVVGFATPNPLPNHFWGGGLGAWNLRWAW